MKILVVFFGGYKASQENVNNWRDSAQKQRTDVQFEAYPFPNIRSADDDDAVNGFEKFDEVTKLIEGSNADQIYIVGHSSGCAIANEVNKRVKVNHKIVTLVDLDGFAPNGDQIKGSTVQAWTAEGNGGQGHSVHWADWKNKYPAASATQPWSLHFSLVNTAATDAITAKNYDKTGYAGCIANLVWLPPKTP